MRAGLRAATGRTLVERVLLLCIRLYLERILDQMDRLMTLAAEGKLKREAAPELRASAARAAADEAQAAAEAAAAEAASAPDFAAWAPPCRTDQRGGTEAEWWTALDAARVASELQADAGPAAAGHPQAPIAVGPAPGEPVPETRVKETPVPAIHGQPARVYQPVRPPRPAITRSAGPTKTAIRARQLQSKSQAPPGARLLAVPFAKTSAGAYRFCTS